MGYVDEDGFIYVLGRCSDTFKSQSGETVYCFDIENVILQNPNISQCEVIGIPTDEQSYVPVAQLVAEPGSALSEPELLKDVHEECKKNLNADCVPRGYKIVEAFPVKNNGKRNMELIRQDKIGYILPTEQGQVVPVLL